MMTSPESNEFDRQTQVLIDSGVAASAGLSATQVGDLAEPLRPQVAGLPVGSDLDTGRFPWSLVMSPRLLGARDLVTHLRLADSPRPGVVDRNHGDDDLEAYAPVPGLTVPDAPLYLLVDVDRGDEFRSVRPRDAVPQIGSRGRSPLTIHEGLSLALQYPAALRANHCFMLAGSRRADKRVPALWIADRAPKLGWCWEGNHHTWLGIASARERVAGE